MAKLIKIYGCDNRARVGDVVFIHGLGGDGLSTWHHAPKEIATGQAAAQQSGQPFEPGQLNFWPVWLGQDCPNLGIWSLDYELERSDWEGTTMPLAERANNVLEIFANKRIGEKPVVFITHSMGGLLTKQFLRNAHDFGSARQRQVAENTKGIVFLATPHSGSNWSNWAQFINGLLLQLPKLSLSVEELAWGHSRLQELNYVFRGHPTLGQLPVKAYYEKQPLKPLGVVVDNVSADLGKPEPPTPVDANHLNICKISPADKADGVVYDSVLLFLEDCLLMAENSSSPDHLERSRLFETLTGIPPGTFGQVLFALNPPSGIVPESMAAQSLRVEALLNWAQGQNGCGLAMVRSVLSQVLPNPR